MSHYSHILFILLLFLVTGNGLFAQVSDTTIVASEVPVSPDTSSAVHTGPKPSSVAIRSAIIPGWGQIVNKQIWKVPIIYGGLGTLAYIFKTNNDKYIEYRNEYRVDSSGLALQYRESYRRNRDLTIIIGAAVYAANILDAYVFANLRDFDVSEDLSLSAKPVFFSNIANSRPDGVGVSFQLNFR